MNILRERENGTVGTEKPPPLVRRCNGTIAGQGYSEVGLDCHLIIPPGQWNDEENTRKLNPSLHVYCRQLKAALLASLAE
jgi:hypothetical protein